MDVQKLLEIREHSGSVYSCKFHDEFIYTASADKFVTRWDPKSATQDNFALKFDNAVYTIELKGKMLYAGLNNGDLHFIDINQRVESKFFQHHTTGIFSLKVNPHKNHLYAGDASGNLSVWHAENESLLLSLPFNCGKIRDVAVDKTGSRIALACQDGTVRILDADHFNVLDEIKVNEEGVNSVLFNPYSESIITGGKDAHLDLWSESGERSLHIPAHNFGIYRILNLGDHFITCSRDGSIKLWDRELNFKSKIDAKTKGHTHSVNDISRIDSSSFISVGDDRRINVWQLI